MSSVFGSGGKQVNYECWRVKITLRGHSGGKIQSILYLSIYSVDFVSMLAIRKLILLKINRIYCRADLNLIYPESDSHASVIFLWNRHSRHRVVAARHVARLVQR